jgi:hypothetical protein
VFRRRTGQRLDGYGGLVFAVGETAVLLLLLLGGLLSFQAWHRAAGHPGNRATRTLDRWAATTRQSSLGPIVRDYNPFDHIAALAEMRRVPETMRRLAAPETLRRVMDDPRITEVRSDPDFVAALEEFRQTPGVQAVASGERQGDGALLVTLLNDDALLRLLDHPDFLPRVREVLAELP